MLFHIVPFVNVYNYNYESLKGLHNYLLLSKVYFINRDLSTFILTFFKTVVVITIVSKSPNKVQLVLLQLKD